MVELQEIKRNIWERLREIGKPVFDTAVPHGGKPPFIRFYVVGMDWLSAFQSRGHFSRTGITVDAVSSSETSTEAESLFASVQEKLDGFSFDTSNGRYKLQLSSVRKIFDDEARLWYVSGDFILHIARKA